MNALYVVAAACLTGQVMDPQTVQQAPSGAQANAPQHTVLFPRLHALLHPQSKRPVSVPVTVQGQPSSSANPSASKAEQIETVTVPTSIQRRYQEKVGHDDDFSWVTGQLYFINADGGRWVVRYATANTEDKYHGNIVLPPDANMRNYREGDLVSVHGEILNNGIPSRFGEAPYYKVNSIDVIERVD
jgi:hypothetical protein